MASDSTLSTVAYIYKTTYAGNVGLAAERFHPLLSMITKTGGFVGPTFNYPIRFGNPQNVSGSFATARAQTTASQGLQLAATRKKKYGYVSIDGEAINAADGDGAFLDLITLETNSVIMEVVDRLAFDLYRDGTGRRGQVASIATNTITWVIPDDARNFKLGMNVVAATATTGLSGNRTGSMNVVAFDPDAGTTTFDNVAGITSLTVNDYIFAAGEASTCMEGLQLCTPLVAPINGDSFRGISRFPAPALLAGSRVNNNLTTIEENAGLLAIKINQNGGRATDGLLNPINFWKMVRRLGAKTTLSEGSDAAYGFESVVINTPAGAIKMHSDPDCPVTDCRLYNAESHYIRTLLDLTHIIQEDGRPNLRSLNDDGIEVRIRSMANYIQTNTRDHGIAAV